MRKIHGTNPEGLLCGLRQTASRQTTEAREHVTCDACRKTYEPPKRYITSEQLAGHIYGSKNTFDWLMTCKVQSGPVVLDAKVFFNLKSRNHKHVILVRDSESWRRKRDDESAIEDGSVLNEKYKRSAS